MGAKDDEGLRARKRLCRVGGDKELTALWMIHDAGACGGIRSRIVMEETKATLHLTLQCNEEGSQ